MFRLNKISLPIWGCVFFVVLLLVNVIFKVADKELNRGLIIISYGMMIAHIRNQKKKQLLEKQK